MWVLEKQCMMPRSESLIGQCSPDLRKNRIQGEPRHRHRAKALLSPLVGQDLYEVGKALEALRNLGQQAKEAHNVGEQPRVRES